MSDLRRGRPGYANRLLPGRGANDAVALLRADPGLSILTFTAEPGSESHEALNLLGSWAATIEQEQTVPTADEA